MKKHRFMAEEGEQSSGGGTPTPVTQPAPAATTPQTAAPAPVTPAPAATATPATAAATPPAEPKGYWPDDWRSRASKGDEKLLSRFSRYGSPEDALEALVHAQNRINSGELKPVLGKEATPEQLSEWRQAHGIPDAHDKYDVADLGEGIKPPEVDKPFLSKILEAAHSSNQTPDQVRATLKAYYQVRDQVEAHQVEKDRSAESAGTEALREEWGAEYRIHSNLIENLLSGTSGELKDQLQNARMPDGTLFKHSPAAQKFLLSLALIQNPMGTLVPNGGNPAQGIREELDRIAKVRRENRVQYNKDVKMQERERELLSAAMRSGIMDNTGNWKAA